MIEVVVLLKTDEYFSELWVVFSNFQKKKREYSIYFVFLSRAMTRLAYRLKRVGIVSARDSTSERTRIHFQKKKKKKTKKEKGKWKQRSCCDRRVNLPGARHVPPTHPTAERHEPRSPTTHRDLT